MLLYIGKGLLLSHLNLSDARGVFVLVRLLGKRGFYGSKRNRQD